jgi:hypothetical protein
VEPSKEKKVVIILYKNGFLVDENGEQGPFRPFTDPGMCAALQWVYMRVSACVGEREYIRLHVVRTEVWVVQ